MRDGDSEVRLGVKTVFEFCGTDALVPHFVVVPHRTNAIRTTMRDGVSPNSATIVPTRRSVLLLVHWAYQAGRKGTRATPFCTSDSGRISSHSVSRACHCACHGERVRVTDRVILKTRFPTPHPLLRSLQTLVLRLPNN